MEREETRKDLMRKRRDEEGLREKEKRGVRIDGRMVG